MWLSFYRSSFLQKESSKKVVITLEDSDLKERFLSVNLPTSPLSQQFVPTCEDLVLMSDSEGGGIRWGLSPYLRYLRSFSSSASLQGFKPLATMPCPNCPLSSMLFLGLLDTSKIGSISFTPVACITTRWYFFVIFRRAKASGKQAGSKRGEPDTCDGRRHSSLASRLPSVAWKTRKNNARYAGCHSWVKIKGAIYEEKTILAHS